MIKYDNKLEFQCIYTFKSVSMRFRCGSKFLYCLLHLLAWIRADDLTNPPKIKKLFRASTPPNESKAITGVLYTEGGNVDNNAKTMDTVISDKSKVSLNDLELLISKSETSSIVARKGVHLSSVVPKKGAPNITFELSSSVNPPPVNEVISTSSLDNAYHNTSSTQPINGSVVTHRILPSIDNSNIPHKPIITIVPADSDIFLKSLKSDRNVVIPVVALVFVPLLVLLALFIYKRCKENGAHYTRMNNFLIEDIYND